MAKKKTQPQPVTVEELIQQAVVAGGRMRSLLMYEHNQRKTLAAAVDLTVGVLQGEVDMSHAELLQKLQTMQHQLRQLEKITISHIE